MSAGDFPWWYPRRSHEAWSKVRDKGIWRFVFIKGLLGYGGLMFVFTALLSPYIRHSTEMLSPDRLAMNAAIWAVAGLAWGAITWHVCERAFLKYATHIGKLQP
jgi:hypothetical protein